MAAMINRPISDRHNAQSARLRQNGRVTTGPTPTNRRRVAAAI